MLIHAQHEKQRALAQLRHSFLEHRLALDTPDVHHRVLMLLLCLARRPLDSGHAPALHLTSAPLERARSPFDCSVPSVLACLAPLQWPTNLLWLKRQQRKAKDMQSGGRLQCLIWRRG